jgi:hypothetical protein
MSSTASNEFALLASILNKHDPWCLLGALALNCYVEEQHTWDVDIVIATLEADSIKRDLMTAGFSLEEFPPVTTAKMKGSDLDIRLTADPRHQKFLLDAKLMAVMGERVPVASPANIARGLLWSWSEESRPLTKRKRDERDLVRLLEAYPELDNLVPEEFRKQVLE